MSTGLKILTLLALCTVVTAKIWTINVRYDEDSDINRKEFDEAKELANLEKDLKELKESGIAQSSYEAVEKVFKKHYELRKQNPTLSDEDFIGKFGEQLVKELADAVNTLPDNDRKIVLDHIAKRLGSPKLRKFRHYFSKPLVKSQGYNGAEITAGRIRTLKEMKEAGVTQPALDALDKLGRKYQEIYKQNPTLTEEEFYAKFGSQNFEEFFRLAATFSQSDRTKVGRIVGLKLSRRIARSKSPRRF
ncbi:unnamed protein product [Caenorhabditis auriculariae]|uniref:Uncharacterized protein n=1 Tax=Caenorhabditis auriculariae TaxID=2777116 RepID=A0A8S1HU33_9PELO|nr:unnamed protein product [Caenorhabditis auriculariae]